MREDHIGVPAHITHYYNAASQPFLNLSELDGEYLEQTLAALADRRSQDPGFKRVFGRRYTAFRRATEEKLHRLFLQAGGKPDRKSPHYFVLGECPWFANLYPSTAAVRVNLDRLDPSKTSFTYPDSFVAMRLGPCFGLPETPMRPYHERVYRIDELDKIVDQFGLPECEELTYTGYQNSEFEKYVEVQVWYELPRSACAA